MKVGPEYADDCDELECGRGGGGLGARQQRREEVDEEVDVHEENRCGKAGIEAETGEGVDERGGEENPVETDVGAAGEGDGVGVVGR